MDSRYILWKDRSEDVFDKAERDEGAVSFLDSPDVLVGLSLDGKGHIGARR